MFISLQEQNLFIGFIIARVKNFLGNLENILFEEHVQQFKWAQCRTEDSIRVLHLHKKF